MRGAHLDKHRRQTRVAVAPPACRGTPDAKPERKARGTAAARVRALVASTDARTS